MGWRCLSYLFSTISKAVVIPPQSTTVAKRTITRTGTNIRRVLSFPNPQGSARRPLNTVPPRTTTAVPDPAKKISVPNPAKKTAAPNPAKKTAAPNPAKETAVPNPAKKRTRSKPPKPQPKTSPPTAIDIYFARFPKFPYNPAQPAAREFWLLCNAENFWEPDKAELNEQGKRKRRRLSDHGKKERLRFNLAFSLEFTEKFGFLREGGGKDKQKWMHLAQVLGFDPIPKRVGEFKESMNTIFVNIFDVLQAAKTGETVRRFAGLEELRVYSIDGDKIFPLKSAKGGALEFLLKKLLAGDSF